MGVLTRVWTKETSFGGLLFIGGHLVILTIRNKTKNPKFHKDFPANYGSHYQDSTISRPIKWPLEKSTTPIFSNFFRKKKKKKKKKRSPDPSRTAESVSHFQNLSMQNWVLTRVPCQTPFGSRTNLKKSRFFPKKVQKIQNSTKV